MKIERVEQGRFSGSKTTRKLNYKMNILWTG